REFLDEVAHRLSLTGFKILVDLVASSQRPVVVREVPYTFRSRQRGESKLDLLTSFEFLILLIDKLTGGWLPATYLKFGIVGALGVAANVLLTVVALRAGAGLEVTRAVVSGAVIVSNFFLNNAVTFRYHRLRGRRRWIGLGVFA